MPSRKHVVIFRLAFNDEVMVAIARKLGLKKPSVAAVRKHFAQVIEDEAEFLFMGVSESDLVPALERSVAKAKAKKKEKAA